MSLTNILMKVGNTMRLKYSKRRLQNFIKKYKLEDKIKTYMFLITAPKNGWTFIVDYVRASNLEDAFKKIKNNSNFEKCNAELLFSFNENAFYTEQFVSMNDISTVLNENEYDDAIYILKMITRKQ